MKSGGVINFIVNPPLYRHYPRPFLCLMNVSSHALDRLVQEEEEKILLRPPGFLHGRDLGAAFFVTKNSLMAVWQRGNFEDYDTELRRNPRPLPNSLRV
jgi:hypothetical protein